MKKTTKALSMALSVLMIGSTLAACNTGGAGGGGGLKGDGGDKALNIRVWDGGYGTDWAYAVAEEFEKEYDIEVNVKGSSLRNQLSAEMQTAEYKNQQYDLYFTDIMIRKTELLTDLSDVYSYTPAGEDKTIAEKFHSDVDKYYKNADGTYYYMPWGIGYTTLTYNADLITEDMVPNTTDELAALCETLKGQGKYAFTFGNDTNYWDMPFMEWWAQYEGLDKYNLYYNGKLEADGIYTSDVIAQQGRLRSLEVLEELLGYENGYTDPASSSLGFMSAQKNYFEGKAAMMYNGSWLENEMSNLFPNGCPFTLNIMKMPIISSIIERLDTISDDATLSAVVDYVDGKAGATLPAGVSEDDVAEIRRARNIYNASTGHQVILPKSAHHVENAKTFLKFLYSKKGVNAYMQNSNGSNLMITGEMYDAAWVNSLSPLQKSVLNMLNSDTIEYATTPVTPLTLAGLGYRKTTTYLELLFCSQNAKDRMSAQEIYQYDIDYYTGNNGKNWNTLLTDAGIH